MKKKISIIVILWLVVISASAQLSLSAYFDGYWSEWKHDSSYSPTAKIHGNYSGFIIYLVSEGPWEYRFKFTIDNMNFPDKKQRKKDMKADKWYEFTGTVEYYVGNQNSTALSIFRQVKGPNLYPRVLSSGLPAKKITSRATIRIAAFKDLPKVYNIYYDNVGLAISLGTIYFPNVVYP